MMGRVSKKKRVRSDSVYVGQLKRNVNTLNKKLKISESDQQMLSHDNNLLQKQLDSFHSYGDELRYENLMLEGKVKELESRLGKKVEELEGGVENRGCVDVVFGQKRDDGRGRTYDIRLMKRGVKEGIVGMMMGLGWKGLELDEVMGFLSWNNTDYIKVEVGEHRTDYYKGDVFDVRFSNEDLLDVYKGHQIRQKMSSESYDPLETLNMSWLMGDVEGEISEFKKVS